ncbi:hypothetical protein ACJJTC_007383 [Scirpophaga incertulas]
MSSTLFWSIVAISYQTTFSVVLAWLTLYCKLAPNETEFKELTLMKLLYLYDPEACQRVYFYNYTRNYPTPKSIIIWTTKNNVAASFRRKIQLNVTLHVLWTLLGLAHSSQSRSGCGTYGTLLPFTACGVTILVMDLVHTGMYLMDVTRTSTEVEIMKYIDAGKGNVKTMSHTNKLFIIDEVTKEEDNTSWIALLMAYLACRAVVQWVINLWIVKDNFFEGMERYRQLQKSKLQQKTNQKR